MEFLKMIAYNPLRLPFLMMDIYLKGPINFHLGPIIVFLRITFTLTQSRKKSLDKF